MRDRSPRTPRVVAIATAFVVVAACGHDHDHDHDHDHLAAAACEQAETEGEVLAAAIDADGPAAPAIVAGAAPVTITLTAGERNFVWLTTEGDHVDAAIFVRPAGALVALLDEDTEASYSLNDAGPPASCEAAVAADYRVHLHMPKSYRLELDPSVATSVWLLFVDEASDHAPSAGEHGHTH